jgi:hypothetical protein
LEPAHLSPEKVEPGTGKWEGAYEKQCVGALPHTQACNCAVVVVLIWVVCRFKLPQDGTGGLLSMPRHKVQVEACEDLRLTLLRYWTIEDSLR